MLCMYVSVFAAKTAERPCPENLISGLQSASSNKGFLQGGGTVYLSFYLFISLETVFFFFFHFQSNMMPQMLEEFQPVDFQEGG